MEHSENSEHSEFVIIFEGSPWEAGLVDSMLKDAGIMTTVYGGLRDPYSPLWHLGGVGATRVMILSGDYEKAQGIVDQYVQSKEKDTPGQEKD